MPKEKIQWRNSRKKIAGKVLLEKDFAANPEFRFSVMCSAENPAISGRVENMVLQEGLSVHCVEGVDLRDGFSSALTKSGLRIMIVLEGVTSIAFGGSWMTVDAEPAANEESMQGMIIGLANNTLFERRWRKGKHERKVTIQMSSDWLEKNGFVGDKMPYALHEFLTQSIVFRAWQPSIASLSHAEKIIEDVGNDDSLTRLSLLVATASIVRDALACFLTEEKNRLTLVPGKYQDIHKVRAFLDDPQYFSMSIADIVQTVSLSASTLQRHFRASFGVTIEEYRRDARLRRARDLLETEGVGVAEVAAMVGYNNAANFSTAFKRHFGILPKAVRSRVG
jgi:AraC-like DNA-binding protein